VRDTWYKSFFIQFLAFYANLLPSLVFSFASLVLYVLTSAHIEFIISFAHPLSVLYKKVLSPLPLRWSTYNIYSGITCRQFFLAWLDIIDVLTVLAMDKWSFFSGISICVLLNFASVEAAPKGSLITGLPGFNGVFPSNHYSGQVNFPFTCLVFII